MDEIEVITNWSASRSGPAITIVGWQDGRRVRITGVMEIAADAEGPIATLKADGDAPPTQYRLR